MRVIPREQMLHGPLVRTLFQIGWPVMVSSLLATAYTLADTFWLGRLVDAKDAVAALQISWPILFFLISFTFGFSSAGMALVSQYTGAQMHDEAEKSAGQVISVSFLMGLGILVLGVLLSPIIVSSLGLGEHVTKLSVDYMRIIFLGLPFTFGFTTFGFIVRSYGDPVTPMIVEGTSVILNIALDPLLIFGIGPFPEMGVAGAALATVATQSLATILSLVLLYRGTTGLKLRAHHFTLERKKVEAIFKIGIPSAVGQSATGFGFFILMYVIALLPESTVALAAYGIGDRVITLIFISINGLSAGISTVLGQSLGACDIKRASDAVKKGTVAMFSILVACALFSYILRRHIIGFFIMDGSVIDMGALYLQYALWGIPFYGLFSGITAAFRGSGHNVPSMIIEVSRLWLLRIPLTYLLGIYLGYGAIGIWIGMALSNIFGSVIAVGYFKTGIWQEKIIEC